MTSDLETLRFPIGLWQAQNTYSPETLRHLIDRIRQLPNEYDALVTGLDADDLAKQYRPGSWNVAQLVHHVADTHLLHLLRFKHALTEPNPTGVVGNVNAWAMLEEAQTAPLADSILLLRGLHQRIAHLGETLTPEQLALTYYHPVRQRSVTMAQALSMVVWHGEHHLAHIRIALG